MTLLLQSSSIWNLQGSVTAFGVVAGVAIALYFGLLSPRHVVQKQDAQIEEFKKLLGIREDENTALHAERIKDIEEKAELRGEVSALRGEVAMHRQEVKALREEVVRLRQSREK